MKITSIILSAMIGLSLASCHDDLNTKPYDTFDADEVFFIERKCRNVRQWVILYIERQAVA